MINKFISIKEENQHKIYNVLGLKFKFKNRYSIENLKEFAKIIGAKLPQSANSSIPFTRVITQSQYVVPGDFVIDAGWYDSEKVITESIEKGAAAIFCSAEIKEKLPQSFIYPIDNPMDAVYKFEVWRAQGCNAKRITITGSVGKTTTTGLINSIIANSFNTLTHNPMSNSHGAILRNVQRLNSSHKYWVQEVGGVAPGYIESSAPFLNPDIVVLTNISASHLDLYKTKQNIFIDKSSLERYAKKNAQVIINYDDEILRSANFSHKVITCSLKDPSADYFAKDIRMDNRGLYFTAICKKTKNLNVHLNLLGEYNAYNALFAIAVGELAGVKLENMPELLETYYPSQMRQNHIAVGGYSIFVDTFNAEPATLLGTAKTLEKMSLPEGGKKIFVAGHIDKLGVTSKEDHKKLGYELAKLKIDIILLYAGDAKYTYEGLKEAGFKNAILMQTREELDNWLRTNATRNDEIFFKGGQFVSCLAKTVDHVFGTTLQNALQYNNGYVAEANGYKFCIRKDDIAEIKGYTGKDTELIIPANYENNISTRIAPFAFTKNKNITNVYIPDSISVIGKEAFYICSNLRTVHLPQNLLYIDKNAFNCCTSLQEINIPSSVIHIERHAFYDCKQLKRAVISENVGFIGEDAFKNTSKDFEIVCPKGSYAENYAKENNIKITYVESVKN